MRELTVNEVDSVSGGVVPVLLNAMAAAAVIGSFGRGFYDGYTQTMAR